MREIEGLAERIAARQRLIQAAPKRAAVLVPLLPGPEGPSLLLTRRSAEVSSHQGQVAFPGGRMEPTDPDAVANALREAEEEVGLGRELVEVLGLLDDIPTITGTTMVTPVVGHVRSVPTFRAQEAEVARIFSIPVRELQRKERWRLEGVSWRGVDFPMFFFDHDGETLWGMSAYVTLQLLSLLPGGAPYTVPAYSRDGRLL